MCMHYDPIILLLFFLSISATVEDFSFNLTENSKKDTIIGSFKTLSCETYTLNDLDECCAVNYQGWLQTLGPTDWETTSSYSGTLGCEINQSPFFQLYDVYITIGDENDNSPVFSQLQQYLTLPEQTKVPSQPFPLVGAVDIDSQTNSVSRYELVNGSDLFELQTGSWSAGSLPLSLVVIKALDYENDERLFNIKINAYDKDDNSATMTLTVTITDINDNKPAFDHASYSGTVSEDAPTQKVVAEVRASDRDGSSPNNVIEYSLIGDDLPFAIQESGDIIVIKALDREASASYTFQVRVTDTATPPLSNTANVIVVVTDINDNAPAILSPTTRQAVVLKENLPADSLVTGVQISDLDEGENSRVTVSLTGSNSDRFKYVLLQGGIGQILTTQSLDREDMSSYMLIISASDNGTTPLSNEIQFTVNVLDQNDESPVIGNCADEIDVAENFVGVISTVTASDGDEPGPNSRLKFSVTDTANYDVDAASGTLSLKVPFDFETTTSAQVTVAVTDSGTLPLQTECTFNLAVTDVNDNPPTLQTVDHLTISEDTSIGTVIATLTATDPDKVDSELLRFSISPPSNYFSVNYLTGVVSVSAALDRETEDSHLLNCVVEDSGKVHSDTIQIQIAISDISDTPPQFLSQPYKLDISDSEKVGSIAFKVEANDMDQGDTLTFRLDTSSAYFSVDETTGDLIIKKSLDDAPATLTFGIVVNDGKFDTKASLVVNVFKDDGVAPVVTMKIGNKLSEGAALGSVAGQCSGSSVGPVTYSLSWNANSSGYVGLFAIDSNSGAISTSGQLDFESYEIYELTCVVKNIHGHTTQATITVPVSGVNEFEPEFERALFFFSTTSDVENEKVVGAVLATDKDRGNDGLLQYHLVTALYGWDIKSGTGEIVQMKSSSPVSKTLTAGSRTKRATGSYHEVEFMVEVRDSPADRSSQKSATANVTISVHPLVVETDSGQIILIGSIAGGATLLILLIVVVFLILYRRRKASSGSKDLVYVNATSVTDKDGRQITADKGYHSGDKGYHSGEKGVYNNNNNIQLTDMSRYNNMPTTYSSNELGQYADPPHYDTADNVTNSPLPPPPSQYLNVRDKLVPHKMSVSTVLSDLRNDVQVSSVPRRLTGSQVTASITHSGSYESVHVFGSEGGGEGDAAIDTHTLFKKLSDIQDTDVIGDPNKPGHILGDQDSAFSSLGSSNGEISTPYHTEYLQNWKPAFESVGTVCEGMLRNKQFAYQSSRTTSRNTSSENVASDIYNTGSASPVHRNTESLMSSPAHRNTESLMSSSHRAESLASGDNVLSSPGHVSHDASVHSYGSTTHL